MKKLKIFVLLIIVLFFLILMSCTSLDKVRVKNRQSLSFLTIGMSKSQVLQIMGYETIVTPDTGYCTTLFATKHINNPYRTELYRLKDDTYEILFYYTDIKKRDDVITDDELTPIIIKNGKLDGYGWMYWNDLIKKYQIFVR